MAKFVYKVGKEEVVREGDRVSIGTRSTCSFTLDDPLAADLHCDIVLRGQEFVIIDRETSLGTYVNGLAVEAPRTLADGDEIVIAVSRIKVKLAGDTLELAVDRSRFYYDDKADALDLSRREVSFGRFRPVSAGNWLVVFAMLALLPLSYCGPTSEKLVEPGPSWHYSRPEFATRLAELNAQHGADREGCNACHAPFDRNLDVKCMDCHAGDLQKEAQHPFYDSAADWERGCNHCHVDHRGDADQVWIARHAEDSCGDCHEADRKIEKNRPFALAAVQVGIGYDTFSHKIHHGKKLDEAGRELSCDDCHEPAPTGAVALLQGDRPRDFRRVDYQKCLQCHGKTAPEKRALEPTWHGTTAAAGETEGQKCLQCHVEAKKEALRTIADFDAERRYTTVTRSHDAQVEKAHQTADGRSCASCHRSGTEMKGGRELATARFGHGVHVLDPWAEEPASQLRFSGNADRPGKGECVHCHQATARSASLATERAQEYATQSCQSCHTSAAPREDVRTRPAPDRPDFPHDRHLKVEGGCYACHVFPRGDVAMMPETPLDVRSCVKCHKEHDSIAGGDCDACHKKGDPSLKGELRMVTRTPDANYDHLSPGHRPWTEAGRCVDCHGAEVWEAETIGVISSPGETAPVCRQCHVEEKARFHWR